MIERQMINGNGNNKKERKCQRERERERERGGQIKVIMGTIYHVG